MRKPGEMDRDSRPTILAPASGLYTANSAPLAERHPDGSPPSGVVPADRERVELKPADLHLERCVPVRKLPAVNGMPNLAAFLFCSVDGRASIAEIALAAQLPTWEAIDCFLMLARAGAVDLGAVGATTPLVRVGGERFERLTATFPAVTVPAAASGGGEPSDG